MRRVAPSGFNSAISRALSSYVSGSAAMPRLIAASSSGVGGMSLRFLNITDLSAVCLAQADNVHGLAALRKYQAVQAIMNYGVADLAQLEIVSAVVGSCHHLVPVDLACEDQRHAVLSDIAGVFGGI